MLIPSVPQLAIIAVIVGLITGTRRLREFGGDLGGMIKGFRSGMKDLDEVKPELRELAHDVRQVKQLSTELVRDPARTYEPLYRPTHDIHLGGRDDDRDE